MFLIYQRLNYGPSNLSQIAIQLKDNYGKNYLIHENVYTAIVLGLYNFIMTSLYKITKSPCFFFSYLDWCQTVCYQDKNTSIVSLWDQT